MKFVLFCHSLLSDWNHGNAHFLRGIVTELQSRGHEVHAFEPIDAWSAGNLAADEGSESLSAVFQAYPSLRITRYATAALDLDHALDGADVVLVHEWNPHGLVAAIGRHRARGGSYHLLFHDTHHRSVTEPRAMQAYDLSAYDGVLAFGEVIRERYVSLGWARRAWTWHEAADTRLFRPRGEGGGPRALDLIWIGNWGDDERSQEIREYLIEPVQRLGFRARVHGVRYPSVALEALAGAGIDYAGWLPNYRVPEAFAAATMTVHLPRRPYVERLPGIPTIRMFEALACGVPLASCWWDDVEGLFRRDVDYLSVTSPIQMTRAMRNISADPALARSLSAAGVQTILARHTCAHRVDELMGILAGLGTRVREKAATV
jgi:spore maturation protein CgeB